MGTGLHLGPFELLEPLGAGAMGEVWRGRHHELPVAIKLLTSSGAREARYREALENEVHAVAGLTHPHIVRILDHGEVGAELGGRFPPGAPYLAMELADGPVERLVARDWPQIEALLRQVLDALAHAHARGIVHRDLKPDNVLRFGRGHFKLADFGIARPVWSASVVAPTSGTLAYMAPEQVRGAWRDQGPATDLYALGCFGWELVAGRPPFVGLPGTDLTRGHLFLDVPPLPAPVRAQVPEGYESWLRRLLEKLPEDRFACAADALHALDELGPVPLAASFAAGDAAAAASSEANATWTADDLDLPAEPTPESGARHGPAPRTPAPMPADWRRRETFELPRLRGVGLRLYGLRAIPIAGREAERDLLWGALREVEASGTARAVLLRGHAGEGKSTLSRWLCERAAETGAAVPVQATWARTPGPGDGLGPALARRHGCVGLDLAQTRERLQRRLGHGDPTALGALAALIAGDRERTVGEERQGLLRWALAQEDRPVVLALDDAQWSVEAVQLARALLRGANPVLVVLTLRADLLAALPEVEAEVEALAGEGAARSIALGPLPVGDRRLLVRDLLGLEEGLAARVEERTAGNPLFAVHLVGDWVRRGLLVTGPDGFTLRDGAADALPDDLYAAVAAQVEALLAARPEADRLALEVAAALGEVVRAGEWDAACHASGIAPPEGLVGLLREHRLARRGAEPGEWAFAHGMLRDALERQARAAGRWAGHHARIAEALGEGADPGRLGVHRLEAGDVDGAVGPLLAGARRRRSEARAALALLARWEEAMRASGAPEHDPRWPEGHTLRAWLLRASGAWDDAARWAERAAERARAHGHPVHEAEALLELAQLQRARIRSQESLATLERAAALAAAGGPVLRARVANQRAAACTLSARYDDSLELLLESVALGEALGEDEVLLEALALVSVVHGVRGDHAAMIAWTTRSLEVAERLGAPAEVAECHQRLASAALQAGHHHDAARHARQALATAEALGHTQQVAHCRLALAEAARYQGAYEEAEQLLEQVLVQYRISGRHPAAPSLSLGMVHVAMGRTEEGRARIEEVRARLEADGRAGWVGACHAFLLPGASDDWDHHFGEAKRLLEQTKLVQRDVLWALELAADRAPDAARRAQVLALARPQAEGLKDEVALGRIRARLPREPDRPSGDRTE